MPINVLGSHYEAHLSWQQSAHMTTQRVWRLHYRRAGGSALRLIPALLNRDWTEWVTLSVELSVWCCTIVPPLHPHSSRKESLSKRLLHTTNCAFYFNIIRESSTGSSDLSAVGGFPHRKTVTWFSEKIERGSLRRGVIDCLDNSNEMNGEWDQCDKF